MEIKAVTRLGRTERRGFQLAQVLDAVALEIGFGFDGCIAQFGACLDVEEKQQPVHEAQRFEAELLGQIPVVAVEDLFLRHLPLVADGFVADQFDAGTQRVFEVGGHRKGMTVRAFIQRIEQRDLALGRQYGGSADERRHTAQAALIARAEQLGQFHLQAGLAGPLAPFGQHPVLVVHQQHPAWRGVVGKETAGERVFPGPAVVGGGARPAGGSRSACGRLCLPAGGAGHGVSLQTAWGQLQRREVFLARQGHGGTDGQ